MLAGSSESCCGIKLRSVGVGWEPVAAVGPLVSVGSLVLKGSYSQHGSRCS